jgi:hypothetical protein
VKIRLSCSLRSLPLHRKSFSNYRVFLVKSRALVSVQVVDTEKQTRLKQNMEALT